jgi:hypothetical protein
MRYSKLVYIFILSALTLNANNFQTTYNYFGNIVYSTLDTKGYTLNHYNHDNIDHTSSFSPYSKVGGQITYYNDKYKYTAQAITYKNHGEYEAKLTWLNVNYEYNKNISYRIGRMQTYLLMHADSQNIDYVHTMVHPPLEVYRIVALEHYDALEVSYKNNINDRYNYNITITPFGHAKENINTKHNVEEELELENIKSIKFNLTNDDNFEARFSYSYMLSTLPDSPELKSVTNTLKNYNNDVSRFSYEKKDTTILTLGLNYSYNQYIINSEISQYETDSMNPDTLAYYLMLGYNHNQFTPYIAYSSSNNKEEHFTASNINAPDAQSQYAKNLLNDFLYLTNYTQKTKSIGLRYDIKPGLAFKTQIDKIETKNYGIISNTTKTQSGYERRGILARFVGVADEPVYVYSVGISFAF